MITRIYRISCDHTACTTLPIEHACSEQEVGGPGDTRAKANRAGWRRLNGKDWCPLHAGDQRDALAAAPLAGTT